MSILTMSDREIRRRVRDQRVVLWGSTHWRQFGSPEDLRLAQLERVNWARFSAAVGKMARGFAEAMVTMAEAAQRVAAVFGNYGLALADHIDDDQRETPRSWEVEREGFMRKLGDG